MPGEKGFLSLILAALLAAYLPYSAGKAGSRAPGRPSSQLAPSGEAAATAGNQTGLEDAISLVASHFGLRSVVDPATAEAPSSADGSASTPDTASRLQALHVTNGASIEFVIATLPDPIDSNARWQFDPLYDSVQRAISASGFAFDRFYIPDWDSSQDARVDQRTAIRLHERLPGVVLFRRQADSETHFLALLLVFETATGGIHQAAMRRAVATVVDWCSAKAAPWCTEPDGAITTTPTIRIVGPTFSGSIPSLGDAIRSTGSPFRQPLRYHIVSGSATGKDNKKLLETIAVAGTTDDVRPEVTYRTTVLTDAELVPLLGTFLATHVKSERTAVLLESNTAYGNDLRRVLCGDESSCSGYELLPFPLHISRLRTAVDSTSAASREAPEGTGRNVPLLLGEPAPPRDQMPSVEPSLTSSSIDVTIDQILRTIEREHVSLIGLFATDARDKLFLAQQISLRSPDALLFTIDGDLLFMHQDYLQYTRGMIVASSYPLFTGTQLWNPTATGDAARQQFASSSAQGVYNAALAQLQYDENGDPVVGSSGTPLLDYQSSSRSRINGGPFAWISMVGRDGIWPLREDEPTCGSCGAYLQRISTSSTSDDRPIHPSGIMTALLVLIQIVVVVYSVVRWRRPRVRNSSRSIDVVFLQSTSYAVLIALEALTLFLLTAYYDVLLPYTGRELEMARGVTITAIVMILLVSVVLSATAVRDLVPRADTPPLRAFLRRPLWVVPATGGTVLLMAVPATSLLTPQLLGTEPLLALNRAFQLFNGVSPLAPLMIVFTAVFAWSELLLSRATPLLATTLVQPEFRRFNELAAGGLVDRARAAANAAGQSILFARVKWIREWPVSVGVALAATVAFSALMSVAHVQTTEKTSFDAVFLAGWLVLQTVVWLALADHYVLWRNFKVLLKSLALHPISSAFKRVPTELFANRLPARRVRLIHLQHALNAGAAMGLDMTGLQRRFEKELADPTTEVGASKTWHRIVAEASKVTPVGEHEQLFVLIPVALVIRDLGARVARGIYLLFGGLFALVMYQMSFRAYPRGIMLGVTWFYVVAGIAVALSAIVSAERDVVLSYLSGTEPGKIQWDSVFITRTVLPLLFALFTLFAMQFPDAGGMVLRWLRPVQTALP